MASHSLLPPMTGDLLTLCKDPHSAVSRSPQWKGWVTELISAVLRANRRFAATALCLALTARGLCCHQWSGCEVLKGQKGEIAGRAKASNFNPDAQVPTKLPTRKAMVESESLMLLKSLYHWGPKSHRSQCTQSHHMELWMHQSWEQRRLLRWQETYGSNLIESGNQGYRWYHKAAFA